MKFDGSLILIVFAALSLSHISANAQTVALISPDHMENFAASTLDVLPNAPSTQPSAVAPASKDLPLEQQPHPEPTLSNLPGHILSDLGHIAISPIYLRSKDLVWALPMTGATAAALATDPHTMTEVVSTNPSFNNLNGHVSDGLLYGFIGLPVTSFVIGKATHNEHTTEAGMLGSEAIFDAYIVDSFVKLVSFRERPNVDKGQGEFYVGSSGFDSSFVSGHSMISWSSAAVIADEYHSKWVKIAAYSAASGVSLTRVMAQQHFPTDVLLGAAGGWLIGHYVFRAHHHWSQVK
jgi:hypothetical protein